MFTLTVPQTTTRQQIAKIRAQFPHADFRVKRDQDAACASASGKESYTKAGVVQTLNSDLAGV